MATPNLTKLASMLSAEERYKLVIAELHRTMAGEKPLLSDWEAHAIMKCQNHGVWEEYTRHMNIIQWADLFWSKDIETERLRVYSAFLFLNRMLDRVMADTSPLMPKDMWDAEFARVRESVKMFEDSSIKFFAYRDAVATIERELYGVPLWGEKKKAIVASCYEMVDEFYEEYNWQIRAFSKMEFERQINLLAEDTESYVAKKPVPERSLVDQMVKDIVDIAEAELQMLTR